MTHTTSRVIPLLPDCKINKQERVWHCSLFGKKRDSGSQTILHRGRLHGKLCLTQTCRLTLPTDLATSWLTIANGSDLAHTEVEETKVYSMENAQVLGSVETIPQPSGCWLLHPSPKHTHPTAGVVPTLLSGMESRALALSYTSPAVFIFYFKRGSCYISQLPRLGCNWQSSCPRLPECWHYRLVQHPPSATLQCPTGHANAQQ